MQAPALHPSRGIDRGDRGGGVLLHSGEMVLARMDMAIRGRSLGFALVRTYRSIHGGHGPLGPGWTCNYFTRLEELPSGDVIHHTGDGRSYTYVALGAGAFTSPPGFFTALKKEGTGYRLRNRHGLVHHFALDGRLTRTQNRLGDRVDLGYTGALPTSVTDELGRIVVLAYDTSGRLGSVTDFTGREVRYTYDGEGRLVTVRSPTVTGTPTGNDFPAGRTERYRWLSSRPEPDLRDNLVGVEMPEEFANAPGTEMLQVTYGISGHTRDRVTAVMRGGTNASGVPAGGTLSYAYDFAPAGGPLGTTVRTTVNDRNGNVTRYDHDASGHALRVVESPGGGGFTTSYTYDADGNRTSAVLPQGNRVDLTYDSLNPDRFQQGNLLEVKLTPDAARGGDQTEIVTTYAYDPLYNRRRVVTTPRGNDPSYVPQNGGVQSAARYTSTTTFDWQEAAAPPAEATDWGIVIPPGLLGQGDVNGDGRTDQAAGQAVGLLLPAVQLAAGGKQAADEGSSLQVRAFQFRWNDFGQLIRTEDPRGNVEISTYHPEQDPDGDGANLTPGRDPTTGGYLAVHTRDALLGPNRKDPGPATVLTTSYLYDARGNVVQRTDPRGFTWTSTYNALDELIVFETPKVHASQADGYVRTNTYDANGRVTAQAVENETTDPTTHLPVAGGGPAWFVTTYAYDILGRGIRETRDASRDPAIPPSPQPTSLVTEYVYDANENLIATLSPLATAGSEPQNRRLLSYDARDLVATTTRGGSGPAASTISYGYDANRNLVRVEDAEGGDVATFTYDGYDRQVLAVDRGGNTYARAFSPEGRPLRAEVHGPATAGGPTVLLERTVFLYDEAGRRFGIDHDLFLPVAPTSGATVSEGSLVPGDGRINARFEYDANNRLTYRISDDEACYAYVYDGADRRIRVVTPLSDPAGPTATDTVYTYDGNSNVVRRDETHSSPESTVPPVVLTTHQVYDALNRRVRTTDPLGQTTYLEYDSRGNVVSAYDAEGPSMADPLGLFAGPINGYGNPTRFAYDGADRHWMTVRELRAGGLGGNPIDTSNPAIPTGLIRRVDAFDANGRVVARTDGNGNTTTYAYDALDRLVLRTNADGGTASFLYDRDHNLVQYVDENGTTHDHTYDALDRHTRHQIATGGALLPGATLSALIGTTERTFEYDGLGRLIRSTDDNDPATPTDDAVVEYRYDSLSRRVEEIQGGAAVGSSYAADDRVEVRYPGAGRVVHMAYDAANQCVEVSNLTSLSVKTGWLGASCPPITRSCAVANPAPTTVYTCAWQLNPKKLVMASQAQTAGGVVSQEVVQRARDDAIVQQQLLLDDNAASQVQVAFDWDLSSLNQIVGHDRTRWLNAASAQTAHDVQYGPAQEILSVADRLSPATETHTFSPTYERTHAPYTYLAQGTGIRLADGQFLYQWDGLNRLRTVRLAANPATIVATYDYDADPSTEGGRRIRKNVTGLGLTRFLYDGAHCIEERGAGGQVQRQFIYGGNGADDIVAMDTDTNADGNLDTLYFYGRDAGRNVTHLVDTAGNPVEFYTYDHLRGPEILHATTLAPLPTSGVGNPFLFTGRRFDAETGLYYYRARQFDPLAGEFLSRDPLGIWGDAANDGNPMAYCANDMWNRSDPTGLDPYEAIGDAMAEQRGEGGASSPWKPVLEFAALGAKVPKLGYPEAAELLQHYLAGSGETFYVDMDHMLKNVKRFRERAYDRAQLQAEEYFKSQLDCCGKSPQLLSTRSRYRTAPADPNVPRGWSNWIPYYIKVHHNESWNLALQSIQYQWNAMATMERVSTKGHCHTWAGRVRFHFEIKDVYDFADKAIGAELVAGGDAKPFKVRGLKSDTWTFTMECCCKCSPASDESAKVEGDGGGKGTTKSTR